jgi:hypothetical protein
MMKEGCRKQAPRSRTTGKVKKLRQIAVASDNRIITRHKLKIITSCRKTHVYHGAMVSRLANQQRLNQKYHNTEIGYSPIPLG